MSDSVPRQRIAIATEWDGHGLKDAVVLVTGANRGIGAEFVRLLKERGAGKVYAAARDVSAIQGAGVSRSSWKSPIEARSRPLLGPRAMCRF